MLDMPEDEELLRENKKVLKNDLEVEESFTFQISANLCTIFYTTRTKISQN